MWQESMPYLAVLGAVEGQVILRHILAASNCPSLAWPIAGCMLLARMLLPLVTFALLPAPSWPTKPRPTIGAGTPGIGGRVLLVEETPTSWWDGGRHEHVDRHREVGCCNAGLVWLDVPHLVMHSWVVGREVSWPYGNKESKNQYILHLHSILSSGTTPGQSWYIQSNCKFLH